MSSLAHEGNPKEDEITITGGSVLSTASLDISIPFFGGTPPPPPDVPAEGISSSCSDVFEWAGENDNGAFLGSATGRPWLILSDSPCLSTGNVRTRLADTSLDIRVNSTPTCYGIIYQSVYPLAVNETPGADPAAGASILWEMRFNGVIDGQGRAGPAVWIADTPTKELASLYAVVVDVELGVSTLMRWVAAPLSARGDSLASMRLPVIGELVQIQMIQYPYDEVHSPGNNGIYGAILDASGNTVDSCGYAFEDTKPFNQTTTRHSRMNVGIVSVGGSTAGKMAFNGSPDKSCNNGIAAWLDIDSSGGV